MKPGAPLVFGPRRPIILQPQPDAIPPAPSAPRPLLAWVEPPLAFLAGGLLALACRDVPATAAPLPPRPAMVRPDMQLSELSQSHGLLHGITYHDDTPIVEGPEPTVVTTPVLPGGSGAGQPPSASLSPVGLTIGASGLPPSVAPTPAVSAVVFARAEEPVPFAGQALTASSRTAAVPGTPFLPARFLSSEEPLPEPGRALRLGSLTPSVAPAPPAPIPYATWTESPPGSVALDGAYFSAGVTIQAESPPSVAPPAFATQSAPALTLTGPGAFLSAGNLTPSVTPAPHISPVVFACQESAPPDPGFIQAVASRALTISVPGTPPVRFMVREEPAPAPGQSWNRTSRTPSIIPPPPSVTAIQFARAEEPRPYPGRVVAYASQVIALDIGIPVIRPKFVSREEPPPYPGEARSLNNLTLTIEPPPPPGVTAVTMVRQEPPLPFPGAAWVGPQGLLAPNVPHPRAKLLARQEPIPDPGRVLTFLACASVAPSPPPWRSTLAKQEPPPPFPGAAWVGPQGLIALPVLGDRRAKFFRQEPPLPASGQFQELVSIASITTPPGVTAVLMARQESPPPFPGEVWHIPPPVLVVPYPPRATRVVIVSREEPPPFAGAVLTEQPVVLSSVFTPPIRTIFARQEFSPPGGATFLPIAREAAMVLDTGVAVMIWQEPPPPFPGSTILRPGSVRPSADPRPTRSILPPADVPRQLDGAWLHRFPVIDSTGPMAVDFVAAPLALWLSLPLEICVHAGVAQLFDVSDDFLFFDFIEEVQYERRGLDGMIQTTYCCMALFRALNMGFPGFGAGAVAGSRSARVHIQASTLAVVPRRGDRIISRTKGTWEVASDATETWLSRYMCDCRKIEDA